MFQSHKKEEENINVFIRIKAKTPDDVAQKYSSIEVSNSDLISIIDGKNNKKNFSFDHVFDDNSKQNDIFEYCGKKICDYSLEGYNSTIFAYGQTGSGKTYTLFGDNITNQNINNNPGVEMNKINDFNVEDEGMGLIPRILYYIFYQSSNLKESNEFLFKMSYMEIYNETMIDLLNPDNKNIKINDIKGIIDIQNLRKIKISSPEEAIENIKIGNHFRHIGSTSMIKTSSRSHAIISIYIENNSIKENKLKKSKFHIIDLAGSERQSKTKIGGSTLKESGKINQSLLNLSIIIDRIINNQNPIPYRDCKLTHCLRESIGGNAKTTIIATISQLESNLNETISTLNFAQNAKK